MFLQNQLLQFTTFYHKGFSITGKPKIIYRFIPAKVSILFIYYLAIFTPFKKQLVLFLLKTLKITFYIWSLKRYKTKDLSLINSLTEKEPSQKGKHVRRYTFLEKAKTKSKEEID